MTTQEELNNYCKAHNKEQHKRIETTKLDRYTKELIASLGIPNLI